MAFAAPPWCKPPGPGAPRLFLNVDRGGEITRVDLSDKAYHMLKVDGKYHAALLQNKEGQCWLQDLGMPSGTLVAQPNGKVVSISNKKKMLYVGCVAVLGTKPSHVKIQLTEAQQQGAKRGREETSAAEQQRGGAPAASQLPAADAAAAAEPAAKRPRSSPDAAGPLVPAPAAAAVAVGKPVAAAAPVGKPVAAAASVGKPVAAAAAASASAPGRLAGTAGAVTKPGASSSAPGVNGKAAPVVNGAARASTPASQKSKKCDKCDGPHDTDLCPHFKKKREDHKDAWVNYGQKHPRNMGRSGGKLVIQGGRCVSQPGDGSCLFHSLCYGLLNGRKSHGDAQQLRRELADFIRKNPKLEISGDTIEEWVRWDARSTVQAYASKMACAGWGGGIEMAVCSLLKQVNVHVYERRKGGQYERISCFDSPVQTKKTIHVLYQGGVHYDAFVPPFAR